MSDNKPTSLESILRRFYMDKRADQALPEAIAAITALVPEKQLDEWNIVNPTDEQRQKHWRIGFNDAIGQIHKNFGGIENAKNN